jgi:hypothetical protein
MHCAEPLKSAVNSRRGRFEPELRAVDHGHSARARLEGHDGLPAPALGVVDQQQVDAFAPQPGGVVQPINIDEPTSLADKPMAGYFVG